MKNPLIFALLICSASSHAEEPKADPSLGAFVAPESYRNFRLIAVSQRADEQSLRAILGNEVAVEAARSGRTNPWPNGAVLVKLSWKHRPSERFPAATVPDAFTGAAFMLKDDVKYAATGGWGWDERTGLDQKPPGKPGFAQDCVACHAAVKDRDWVFTQSVKIP
jgi:hypothetical protein